MNTLSNVCPSEGGLKPSDVEPYTQHSSPKLRVSGVTLKYAPHPNKSWYVLRATYGREKKVYDYVIRDGTEAYLPLHYVKKVKNGKSKRVLEPLLPNILFVYSEKEKVDEYLKRTPELSFLRFYYNRLEKDASGLNPPLTVGYKEMMNFIEATSVHDEHLRVVDLSQCHFKDGDLVRIIDGVFRGVQGRVARVADQQRVVVTIDGLCSIATAYIPSAFIEKME